MACRPGPDEEHHHPWESLNITIKQETARIASSPSVSFRPFWYVTGWGGDCNLLRTRETILPSFLVKEIPVDPELWRERANLFAVQNSGNEGTRANITPLMMPITDRRMVFVRCVFLFRNADKHLPEN
jgi:hypothetical protein